MLSSTTLQTNQAVVELHSLSLAAHQLTNEEEAEVLGFLAMRPIHTVFLAGFIRDNGLVSQHNRGVFYGFRDEAGELEGVALIGHATLIEAHTERALAAFAQLASECATAHLVMGEQEKIKQFQKHFARAGVIPRLICRELLMEQQWPIKEYEPVPGLRPATFDDLEHILAVNAEMAVQESGIDPMQKDPIGFRLRAARRIEQNRIWVWIEGDQLIFKVDVVADTPEVIYLEGVYVNPNQRRQGLGLRCFSQLCDLLLARTVSICLLVNERNRRAQSLYHAAGYRLHSRYDTIFL
jgi:uncharacterized protein